MPRLGWPPAGSPPFLPQPGAAHCGGGITPHLPASLTGSSQIVPLRCAFSPTPSLPFASPTPSASPIVFLSSAASPLLQRGGTEERASKTGGAPPAPAAVSGERGGRVAELRYPSAAATHTPAARSPPRRPAVLPPLLALLRLTRAPPEPPGPAGALQPAL